MTEKASSKAIIEIPYKDFMELMVIAGFLEGIANIESAEDWNELDKKSIVQSIKNMSEKADKIYQKGKFKND